MQIEPARIVDIDFSRPKHRRVEENGGGSNSVTVRVQPKSIEDRETFLVGLKSVAPAAAVFSSLVQLELATPAHEIIRRLPSPLTSLYNPKYVDMSKEELKIVCKEVFESMSVSKEETAYLEECTRLQSQCTLWHEHRNGRITASRFHSVFKTSVLTPSISLVKSLLHRQMFDSTKVPALNWGITNEGNARKQYTEAMKALHVNFKIFSCGLYVNPSFPHLGASPDGIMSCDCCGTGLLEIKCPYKYRDRHPEHITDPMFYLKTDDTGDLNLSNNHQYYYQIQGQLAVCEMEFCDFICWTPVGMHVERITVDQASFQDVKRVLDNFFVTILLPCLLTGSASPQLEPEEATGDQVKTSYCSCGGEDIGNMVACDNPTCPIEWFHFSCVGLTRKPTGKWYCSGSCKKTTQQFNP